MNPEQSPAFFAGLLSCYDSNVQSVSFYTRRLLDENSANNLQQWCFENQIPNQLSTNAFHCSVITSPEHVPGYQVDPLPVLIRPKEFRLSFLKEALVIAFDSPALKKSWHRAVEKGVNLTYPTYIGHISVSYAVPIVFDLCEVKPPTFNIRLLSEEIVNTSN